MLSAGDWFRFGVVAAIYWAGWGLFTVTVVTVRGWMRRHLNAWGSRYL